MSFRRSRLISDTHHAGHHVPGMMSFSTDANNTIQGVNGNSEALTLRLTSDSDLLDQWLNVDEWEVQLTLSAQVDDYAPIVDFTFTELIPTGRTGTFTDVGVLTLDNGTPVDRSLVQSTAVETIVTGSFSASHDAGGLDENFDFILKIPHGKWAFNNATQTYILGLELTYEHTITPTDIPSDYDITKEFDPITNDACQLEPGEMVYDYEGYTDNGNGTYTYTCTSQRTPGSFTRTIKPYGITLSSSTFLGHDIKTEDTEISGFYAGLPFTFTHNFVLVITPSTYYGAGLQT